MKHAEFSPHEEITEEFEAAPTPEKISAIEALLSVLEEEGVEYIFGVPGGPLTSLFEALQKRSKIRFVLARHEAGAAFMAAGYALVTGRLAVACGTSGPGGTNALTGVAMAQTNSLPVLFLSGQVATTSFGTGAIQESSVFGTDLVQIFAPVTKLSAQIPSPERFVTTVRHGIRIARSGRQGAVHLNLPANFLASEVAYSRQRPEAFRASGLVIEPAAAAVLCEALLAAKAPVFLAGHGVRCSHAEEELRTLATLTAARVITTPKGKGIFPEDDDNFSGILGFGGHTSARQILADADLVVIFGSSLNEFVLQGTPLPLKPQCKVIQADIDPEMIGRNFPIFLGIIADIRTLVVELLVMIANSNGTTTEEAPVSSDESYSRLQVQPRTEPPHREVGLGIRPRDVVDSLRRAMAPTDLLLVDIGTATLWAIHHFQVQEPGTFFTDLGFGCMGTAVAGAIGAALGAPGRRTVALVGDGAFAMHGFEVHAAVDAKLPITWVVFNNQGHGMVFQGDQLMRGRDLGASRFRTPIDLAAVARGLGAKAYTVTDPADLGRCLAEALITEGPSLVDVHVDLDEVPPTLRQRVEGLAAYIGTSPDFKNR